MNYDIHLGHDQPNGVRADIDCAEAQRIRGNGATGGSGHTSQKYRKTEGRVETAFVTN